MNDAKTINVFIGRESRGPSLNPLDSDVTGNSFFMEQLVGTLVRQSADGSYVSYLAESWSVSSDSKAWKFKLRDGLDCDDGTLITGETYARSILRILRLFAPYSDVPLFEKLCGYNELSEGDAIYGLRGDGQTLTFEFEEPVERGLLEYLALPFLGFYTESNFNKDGSWRDNVAIVASGAYRLDGVTSSGAFHLKLREKALRFVKNPPEALLIHHVSPEKLKWLPERGFVFSYQLQKRHVPEKFRVVRIAPTILSAIVISPDRSTWLKDEVNRRRLREAIYGAQSLVPLELENARVVREFYDDGSSSGESEVELAGVVETPTASDFEGEPLLILRSENPTLAAQYQLCVLEKALQSLGWKYKIEVFLLGSNEMMSHQRNSTKFDLKPVSVNVGSAIENEVIRFMFCSKLGVSFPDPSGRVTNLVKQTEEQFGSRVPASAVSEYQRKLNDIVTSDAVVVPLIKTGHAWLLSPDLPAMSASPVGDIPHFDLFDMA